MAVLTGPDVGADPDRDRAATSLRHVLQRRPGWPLVLLIVGYPLWWVLGVCEIATLLASAAMAYELLRTRTVRVPTGFGVWLLFLAWVALGVLTVQVFAPGGVDAPATTRYLTWGWRLLWYLQATVLLLYLGNRRRQLSLQWVCRLFAWMFVFIVAGGLLGVLAPGFEFRSLLEMVLPRGVTANLFVRSYIHPVAAESFQTLSQSRGRASAPFAYANVWGLNFACFLPFFVVSWLGRDAGWRRFVAPVILVLALVPVVFSLNRGMWAALAAALVFVVVRLAILGRARLLAGLAILVVLGGVVVTLTPLGAAVDTRLRGGTQNSNEGRANLSALGVRSVLEGSPLIGYGTTRDVQGNFSSLAGGGTSFCPRCTVPPLGTQGQFSLVSFTQGLGGVVLYFGFLILQFLRHIRVRSGYALAGLCVLLMHFVTAAVYGADNFAIFAIFAGLALMWRAGLEGRQPDDPYAPGEPLLADQLGLVRDHRVALASLVVVGAAAGVLIDTGGQLTHRATISVVIADNPKYEGLPDDESTLDTVAQFASDDAASRAVARATGDPKASARDVQVTATANTRILHVSYSANSAGRARTVVRAAAAAMLDTRSAQLTARRDAIEAGLRKRADSLADALDTARQTLDVTHSRSEARPIVNRVLARTRTVNDDLAAVQQVPLVAGEVTSPVSSRTVWDPWKVGAGSGIGLALVLWALLVSWRSSVTPRVGRGRRALRRRGVRLLAPSACGRMPSVERVEDVSAVVAASTGPESVAAAARLDAQLDRDRPGRVDGRARERALLVSTRRDFVGDAVRTRRSLERAGVDVVGLVVVDSHEQRGRP